MAQQYKKNVSRSLRKVPFFHFFSNARGVPYLCFAQLFEVSSVSRNEVLAQVNKYRDQAAYNYDQWQKFKEKLNSSLQGKKYSVASYYREIVSVAARWPGHSDSGC